MKRRTLLIVMIIVIMLCSSASAILSLRAGHTPRALSAFFGGLTFAVIIYTRLPK